MDWSTQQLYLACDSTEHHMYWCSGFMNIRGHEFLWNK